MRSAIALRNIVGKAGDILLVRIIPLERRLDSDIIFLAKHVEDGRVNCGFLPVTIFHKGAYATFVFKYLLCIAALIKQLNAYT